MKKIFYMIILACLCFTNCGSSAASKASGKIVIYTSMYRDAVDDIEKVLKKQFPNTQIEFSFGGTGTLQARLEEEIEEGRLGCDILMLADPSYSIELKEKEMLHQFISNEVSALAYDYDPDGFWYPVRISNMVLAFNPAMNSRDTLPKTFYDFAYNANFKDQISMSNPLLSGTTLAAVSALKDKYGDEYFEALGRQNIHIESGAVALSKLETGERKLVMVLEESVLKMREEEKSSLEIIYPTDGIVVIPSTIMIVNKQWSANRNINTAEEITDWFLSREGQNAIVSKWMHSVRVNFEKNPYDAISSATIFNRNIKVNWKDIYRQRDEIQQKFEQQVIYR